MSGLFLYRASAGKFKNKQLWLIICWWLNKFVLEVANWDICWDVLVFLYWILWSEPFNSLLIISQLSTVYCALKLPTNTCSKHPPAFLFWRSKVPRKERQTTGYLIDLNRVLAMLRGVWRRQVILNGTTVLSLWNGVWTFKW
jgi:hypothetical protein